MSGIRKTVGIGMVTALVGIVVSLTPYGLALEEETGLRWLFNLRGTRSAPSDVVVVTTDRKSAFDLGLPQEPWKWPRSYHGRLVKTLKEQGATVIAFDLFFKEAGLPDEDRAFAKAMREAGNVVLIEKMTTPTERPSPAGLVMRIRPSILFAEAATALAPNPLPAVPFRVNQFWLFEPSDAHIATLPFVAFQYHSLDVYEEFLALMKDTNPELMKPLPQSVKGMEETGGIQALAQSFRGIFKKNPEVGPALLETLEAPSSVLEIDPYVRGRLAGLIKAYGRGEAQYLDYYGPPRTVTTVPYSCALGLCLQDGETPISQPPMNFAGKAVFVGFSEQVQSEQKDRFHTVFTSETGLYISGVEIAATAFANLLEDRRIAPIKVWMHVLLLAVWGLLVSVAFQLFPSTRLSRSGVGLGVAYMATMVGAGAAYGGVAFYLFTSKGLWVPLVLPLLLQLPFGMFGTVVWRYREAQRERQNIQRALEHYIPGAVAQQLTKSIGDIKSHSELVEGICLSTDAEHYTALSESLDPAELRTFMNQYYEIIFEPVRRRGGIVSDVVGDAVLAIWAASRLHRELREQVCEAALEIDRAVKKFNYQHPSSPLPTRIGLHGGRMLLGNVGAMDHYEYRAVGDIVNTSTRIEGLNKYLGTRILVSQTVLEDLGGFLTRELGRFRLVGKSQPIVIHELICREEEADPSKVDRMRAFAIGLEAFRCQRWDEAIATFKASIATYGDDGACRFYVEACETFRAEPPQRPWEGIMTLKQK